MCGRGRTAVRLFNPLFPHLFLPFFHRRHLTILAFIPFHSPFPRFSLVGVSRGVQDRGKLV